MVRFLMIYRPWSQFSLTSHQEVWGLVVGLNTRSFLLWSMLFYPTSEILVWILGIHFITLQNLQRIWKTSLFWDQEVKGSYPTAGSSHTVEECYMLLIPKFDGFSCRKRNKGEERGSTESSVKLNLQKRLKSATGALRTLAVGLEGRKVLWGLQRPTVYSM